MTPTALLILNPSSGAGRSSETLHALAAEHRGWLTVREPTSPRDASRLAHQGIHEGHEVIIAAGGDGTIHQVVNGLAGHFTQVRLGIIPLGTANDFAKSLNIPTDPAEALAVIRAGHVHPIDVVRVSNGPVRYLINAATGGFSTTLMGKLTPEIKARWGGLAYFRAAVEAVVDLPLYQAHLRLDGQPLEAVTCAIVIANGRCAGGQELVPSARPDDHLLDVAIVAAQTTAELTRLFGSFAVGTHLESENLIHHQARLIEVHADPAMPFISDGEPVGDSPISFELLPAALQVLTPEEKPATP